MNRMKTGGWIARLAFIILSIAASASCSSRAAAQAPPGPASPPAPREAPDSTPTAAELPPPTPSPPPAPPPEDASADCMLISGERGPDGRTRPFSTVALGEQVDPANAPYPSNESERLLFRQLYETLVRVDCEGRVHPGLASSWEFDEDRRVWNMKLRDDARFSDGTVVTAADVLSAWSGGGSAGVLRPEALRLVQSFAAFDDRSIEITLRNPVDEMPTALAHTDLAVAKRIPGSIWPLGTRSARVAPEGDVSLSGGRSITVERLDASSVRFLVAPGRDGRDLLDEGVDLLLTRDSTVLGYAGTLPQFTSVPMAWQKTRVLLTPGRSRTAPSLEEEARNALAADAVRGEAQGATGPFWWQGATGCELVNSPPASPASAAGRIVYDSGDSAARDLAERLVGLVRSSGATAKAVLDALLPDRPNRTYQRAVGLSGEALAMARRQGNDAGYIVSFDRRPLAPCRELQVLVESLPWVDSETIVPLVDTRLRAVVRRAHSGAIVEWDGGLILTDSGRP